MSPEVMRNIVHRFAVETWGQGNLAVFDEVCAPNYVLGGTIGGNFTLQDLKDSVTQTRQAVPNLQIAIEEMIVEGDKVAYRWKMEGTHEGEFEGIAATHRPVSATGITILHFANGKIVHDSFESSSPSLKDQIS